MTRRRLAGIALVGAIALLVWLATPRIAQIAPETLPGNLPLQVADASTPPPGARARGSVPDIAEVGVVAANGATDAQGVPLTRAARLAEVAKKDAEATATRQRLLFSTLTDLSDAAERAERAGNPAYAAALRRRAEVLTKGVRPE